MLLFNVRFIKGFSSLTSFIVELTGNVLQRNRPVAKFLIMATVRELVLPHHKKEDCTWNVKIRVTHKRKSAYIDTHHFISSKQLRKDFTIKDSFILKSLNPLLDDYRSKIGELGAKIDIVDLPEIISQLRQPIRYNCLSERMCLKLLIFQAYYIHFH